MQKKEIQNNVNELTITVNNKQFILLKSFENMKLINLLNNEVEINNFKIKSFFNILKQLEKQNSMTNKYDTYMSHLHIFDSYLKLFNPQMFTNKHIVYTEKNKKISFSDFLSWIIEEMDKKFISTMDLYVYNCITKFASDCTNDSEIINLLKNCLDKIGCSDTIIEINKVRVLKVIFPYNINRYKNVLIDLDRVL